MPKKKKKGRRSSSHTPASSKRGSLSEPEQRKKSSIEKSAVPAGINTNKKLSMEAIATPEPKSREPREDEPPLDSYPIDALAKGAPLDAEEGTKREKARKERRRRRRMSKASRRSRKKSIAPDDSEDDSDSENVDAKASEDDDDDSEEGEHSPSDRRRRRRFRSLHGGRKRDRVKLVDASTNTPPTSMLDLVGSGATTPKSVQTSHKATQTGDIVITPRVSKDTFAQRSSTQADEIETISRRSTSSRRRRPRVAMSDTTVVTKELRAPQATISERIYDETISTEDDSTYDPSSFSSDFSSEDDVTFSYPITKRRPRKSRKSKSRSTFDPRQAYAADLARDEGPLTSESLEDLQGLSSYLPATGRDYSGGSGRRGTRYARSNDNANIEEYYKEIREQLVEASSANDSEGDIDNRVGRDIMIMERYNITDAPEYAGSTSRKTSAFDDRQASWQPVMDGKQGQSGVSASWNVPSRVRAEVPPTQYAFEAPETSERGNDQPPPNAWFGSQGAARSASANAVFTYPQMNAAGTCSSDPRVTAPDQRSMGRSEAYTQIERQNSNFQSFGAAAASPISMCPVNVEPCAFHKSVLQGGQRLPLAMPPGVRAPTVIHSTCGIPRACHSCMHYCDTSQISQLPIHCCGSSVIHGNSRCAGCQICPQERVFQGLIQQRSRSHAHAKTCRDREGEGASGVGRCARRDRARSGASVPRHGRCPEEGGTSEGHKSRVPRKAFAKGQHGAAGKRPPGAHHHKNDAEGRPSSKQPVASKSPSPAGSPSRDFYGSKHDLRTPCAKRSVGASPKKINERSSTSSAALGQQPDSARETKLLCSNAEDGRERVPLKPEDNK